MAGFLDDSPMGALSGLTVDPRAAALMQMGFGLMGASGPSLTPVSFGQSLGKAGMQGMQAFQQANQANQQQQMFQMKMAEVQRAEAERKKREAGQAALMKDPRFAQFAPFIQAGLPLTSVVDHVMPKPENPFAKVDIKDFTPESVAKYKASQNVADLVRYEKPEKAPHSPLQALIAERDALPTGHPNRALYDAAIKKASTHQPVVTVDNRQENEFGKAVGKEMGDMYAGLLKADMNAPSTLAKYDQLGSLLGSVNTGKFKGTTTDLKAAAKGLGIDLTAMGIRDDVAPAQAARSLANQLALEMRNPAGGRWDAWGNVG